ncbi:hypothetical protein Fmac_025414 [Flemingia macrophylla]|uniref:U-box domain-containing protein n=1 Tax=Flemingia macrophylla TaxID=520843 RepID=A0ABD1LS58_9FABA
MEVKRRSVRSLVSKLSSVSEGARMEALMELRERRRHTPQPLHHREGAPHVHARRPGRHRPRHLSPLLHLLPAAVQSAAAAIHSLLSSVDDYRPLVGSKREIVYALIDILRSHVSSPPRTIKDALKALFAIALHPLNRPSMVNLAVVPALFSLVVKDGRVGIVEDATAVIAQVAGCDDAVLAFRKISGLGVLADLLDLSTASSMRTKENAVSALLNLVRCGGEEVVADVRDVVAFGSLDGVADVRDSGSSKGRSKAAELLRLLLGVSNGSFALSTDTCSSFGSSRNHDSE